MTSQRSCSGTPAVRRRNNGLADGSQPTSVAQFAESYGSDYRLGKAYADVKTDELRQAAGRQGFLAVAIPEEYGGAGGTIAGCPDSPTAAPDGDGWWLRGGKVYISGVDECSHVLVVARTQSWKTSELRPALFTCRPTPSASPLPRYRWGWLSRNGSSACTSTTSSYAKERELLSVSIGQHQAVAHPLAQSHVEIELARLMT